MTDSESQLPAPPLMSAKSYPGAGNLLNVYIAEPWQRDPQGCLETNLQSNPYYPFALHDEYRYIQCTINKQGMKRYYDNILKVENTALGFPSFNNGDGIQKLVAGMPDDQAHREWELSTLKNIRWNYNDQCPLKCCSRVIIKSI